MIKFNLRNRNLVIFYSLLIIAAVLCVAGFTRYERNKKIYSATPQNISCSANDAFHIVYSEKSIFLDDVVESVKLARQQEKPILLLFTAKNCVYSKQMLEGTFQSDSVKPFLQRFILVNVDVNQHRELCRKLSIEATPTIQFMSAQNVPLQRINGVAKPEDLIVCMNSTLQTVAVTADVRIR